jgi:predicted XRE-type DNA-binding protein
MKKIDYEVGSDNVFRDIGLRNAEQHLVKAQLVLKIEALMKQRGMKQAEAARLFEVKQPDISKMLRGDFRQFSVERLMRFLVALDQNVEIVVKPRRKGSRQAAQLRVRMSRPMQITKKSTAGKPRSRISAAIHARRGRVRFREGAAVCEGADD